MGKNRLRCPAAQLLILWAQGFNRKTPRKSRATVTLTLMTVTHHGIRARSRTVPYGVSCGLRGSSRTSTQLVRKKSSVRRFPVVTHAAFTLMVVGARPGAMRGRDKCALRGPLGVPSRHRRRGIRRHASAYPTPESMRRCDRCCDPRSRLCIVGSTYGCGAEAVNHRCA